MDEAILRRLLSHCIQPLPCSSEIPAPVIKQALLSLLEPYVPSSVQALPRIPHYQALSITDERERFLLELRDSHSALQLPGRAFLTASTGLLRYLHHAPLTPPSYLMADLTSEDFERFSPPSLPKLNTA